MDQSTDNQPAKKLPRARHRAIDLVWEHAYQEAADFIRQHTSRALLFDTKIELHRYAFRDIPSEGLICEFGVSKGGSINNFATFLTRRNDPRPIYGFDAFSGLSEDWVGHSYPKLERFDLKGKIPAVRDNVVLVKGWVDDTLPVFLDEHQGPIAFIHVDTDTYSPARAILASCRNRLQEGSIILFDELLGYPGWRAGEYKALLETLPEDSYEFLGFAGFEVMVRMKRAVS